MEAIFAVVSTGFQALTGAAGSAGAAAGTASTAATAGTAAASSGGFSLATLLEGGATLLGAFSAIGAGEAQADRMELAARDAEAEIPLETLQGISRRASIKAELADAIGSQDVAYAASGVDLSFGTPAVARREAFREADYALTTDAGTQQVRTSRLAERAQSYRRMGRQARSRGYASALFGGLDYGATLLNRG